MLERRVVVETPEQVTFEYTLAGIGSRAVALLIDYAICLLPTLLVLATAMAVSGSIGGLVRRSAGWSFAAFVLVQFAILWGYFVLFEGLGDGQTPGKRYLGLRVVQDGGFAVTLPVAAVRNLARVIDMQPGFLYAVGMASSIVSRSAKRLGDVMAGTIVVQERIVPIHDPGIAAKPARVDPAILSDAEYALLDQWMARRQSLDPARRRLLAEQLAARFEGRGAEAGPGLMSSLSKLHERERSARLHGEAGRGERGAQREKHRIVAHGQPRWHSFAKLLERSQKDGLQRLTETELLAFTAGYRELTTDLARLRTATGVGDSSPVFALSRLVSAAHNVLYRRRSEPVTRAWRYLIDDVPREMRRSARPIALAALLLAFPGVVAFIAIEQEPGRALHVLPAEMIDRAEHGVERARLGAGYVDVSEDFRPVLSSIVIANNVQVSFAAFAFGITAGLGTALVLVTNGIAIGATLGLYASKGILGTIVAFVAPHGVLELSAIAVAGGAGMLIASAILIPGNRTRRQALVLQGRRAIRLIAATTVMLLAAGAIEGLFSPTGWPLEAKLFVSAVTIVPMVLWVTRGIRSAREHAPV